MAVVSRYSFRARLVTLGVLLAGALFMFALSSGLAPCQRAFAQSTSCSVGDTETFTGAVTFEDEVNVGATPGPGTAGEALISGGASSPPEWQAAFPERITKTADETVNNGGLQDDDDLIFTVEANSIYHIEGILLVSSATNADFNMIFTVPASAIYDGIWLGELTVIGLSEFSEASAEDIQVSDSVEHPILLDATLQTSAAAGAVTFRWGQTVTQASNTILHAGTVMTFRKMN